MSAVTKAFRESPTAWIAPVRARQNIPAYLLLLLLSLLMLLSLPLMLLSLPFMLLSLPFMLLSLPLMLVRPSTHPQ